MSLPDVLIIGIGNALRGDDGAGPAAVEALEARALAAEVELLTCAGDGLQLLDAWKNASRVILIDTVTSGGEPGTVYRFDARALMLPAELRFSSTHAFGVAEAVELARALGDLPSHLVIYAVEGKNFSVGAGLSPQLERAVLDVVERVSNEVRSGSERS